MVNLLRVTRIFQCKASFLETCRIHLDYFGVFLLRDLPHPHLKRCYVSYDISMGKNSRLKTK